MTKKDIVLKIAEETDFKQVDVKKVVQKMLQKKFLKGEEKNGSMDLRMIRK